MLITVLQTFGDASPVAKGFLTLLYFLMILGMTFWLAVFLYYALMIEIAVVMMIWRGTKRVAKSVTPW
jgi:hypothetical protein